VINQHADFTLLVRDQHSYDFATTHYRCEVKLCPDMAFALGPLQRPVPAIHKLLLLLRTDGEKSNLGEADIPAYAVVADWLVDDPNMQKKMLFPMFWDTLKLGGGALNPMSRLETRFRLRAEARLMRGLAQLSSAEYVITDRLHVHILSLLLGIPHTTLDNSYGKLSRFISAWTRDTGNLYQTLKLDDAIKHQKIAMKKT
jgi:pyruvyl transferase EpsO